MTTDRRRWGNILTLSTPLGLLIAVVGRARIRMGPHGLLLAEGWRFAPPGVGAFTIGDVVITSGRFAELIAAIPRVLDHEERHSRQWLAWGGLPFAAAYGVGVLWSLLRTGNRAARNPFERAAGLADGGYRDVPVRPLRDLLRRRP